MDVHTSFSVVFFEMCGYCKVMILENTKELSLSLCLIYLYVSAFAIFTPVFRLRPKVKPL